MTDEGSRYERVPVPEVPADERLTTFEQIYRPYSLEDAVLEGQRCLQCALPFCVEACPISQDCRGYNILVSERKFDEAARVTLRENPLASTLCKVCYHYCEDACIMAERGIPIAIRQLKRAALDYGKSDLAYVASAPRGQRIAVVGAGPAGLMAAWELGLRGYSITVFEAEPYIGGQVGTIPKYHMDGREILDDVARFRGLDVTFALGKRVGVDFTLEGLLEQGYRAVYLALGTSFHNTLGIPGEGLPGVYYALDLLRALNKGPPVRLGKRIVVIGGGDVAMDAVRSALRLAPGGTVGLYYRKGRSAMPAGAEELEEGDAERVSYLFDRAPKAILGTDRVEGVLFQRTMLSPPGPGGVRSILPVPGSEETVPCDTVIAAVGERSDLVGLPSSLDLKARARGWPEGKHPDTMTGIEGVFASGGKSVVYAMAAGTRSAEGIEAYLARKDGRAPLPRPDPFGGPDPPRLPKGYSGPTWHLD
ncbi:MAG TPA: FAD-dependent oxidoreductase [Thermoplasmata archaeon]|nr:FAD-dependent oxidoreductase [Thermoplasmata archaeon]